MVLWCFSKVRSNVISFNLLFNLFSSSIEKVNRIRSLVLVIHGTDDEVIDISHGIAIHEKCLNPADPLYVEGAGHNDVEIFPQYFERLKNFINSEILNYQTKVIGSDFKKSSFNNKEISSSSNNKNANGFNNEPSELQKQPCLDNSLNEWRFYAGIIKKKKKMMTSIYFVHNDNLVNNWIK